ncbi:hypothetical protein M0R45_019511 [Rubus argutus]|uniref:Uncharacterized protein n=1 Tax=Rubus argutus TaxID=59490 RepID=A0AAW1X990_RUBAR
MGSQSNKRRLPSPQEHHHGLLCAASLVVAKPSQHSFAAGALSVLCHLLSSTHLPVVAVANPTQSPIKSVKPACSVQPARFLAVNLTLPKHAPLLRFQLTAAVFYVVVAASSPTSQPRRRNQSAQVASQPPTPLLLLASPTAQSSSSQSPPRRALSLPSTTAPPAGVPPPPSPQSLCRGISSARRMKEEKKIENG